MLGRKPLTQTRITELLQHHHMLSAPQIVDKMKAEGHPVNKTSVYRALEKMLAAGSICKQVFSEDALLYELRSNHHDHMVCDKCGKVEAVECQTHPPVTSNDFTVNHHHLTLFGLCSNCAAIS